MPKNGKEPPPKLVIEPLVLSKIPVRPKGKLEVTRGLLISSFEVKLSSQTRHNVVLLS